VGRDNLDNKNRVLRILKGLDKAYPDAPTTYLDFNNPFEMLIATILSARATDMIVNRVTPNLFAQYPTPKALMSAQIDDVAAIIHDVGAFNKKADYITTTARMIVEEFGGEVPQTIDELVRFKGVSRKTANVVLQVVFGINEGVVVDTHIMRVSQKLGFTVEKDPKKIEIDLMELLPQTEWGHYARLIGAHGRRTCKARKPLCPECAISGFCPNAEL
jgi:endonuclease-3